MLTFLVYILTKFCLTKKEKENYFSKQTAVGKASALKQGCQTSPTIAYMFSNFTFNQK